VGTNYAGQVGAGGVDDTASFSESPEWQANATLSYSYGPFRTTLQTRYVGGAKLYVDLTGPEDGGYDPTLDNSVNTNRVDDYFIFNLSGSYEWEIGGADVELFAMISNLFDKKPEIAPPLPPGGGYLVTNPVFYDTLGQRYRVGAKMKF
jgi:outer membrane receptor for ferrienterochelin and colicin